MITIPPGHLNDATRIAPFFLDETLRTNAQYADHVDQHRANPFVLVNPLGSGAASIVERGNDPKKILGILAKKLPRNWDTRDPIVSGSLALFELRKDLSPEGFDGPNQPVVKVSWYHAFEYCVSNGFSLPTDDQWKYAAGGPEGHKYGTQSGRLTREEAHYFAETTADVGSYPPNGFGLYDMTGNVWEWTARNPSQKAPYGACGGAFRSNHEDDLLVACRNVFFSPATRENYIGFRVAANLPPREFLHLVKGPVLVAPSSRV